MQAAFAGCGGCECTWTNSCTAVSRNWNWTPHFPSPPLPYPTLPYHTLTYHTLPYHTLPSPALPYHTLPYHIIPCPPILSPTIAYPPPPYPSLAYHSIPSPPLPYPPLPYHTLPSPPHTSPAYSLPSSLRMPSAMPPSVPSVRSIDVNRLSLTSAPLAAAVPPAPAFNRSKTSRKSGPAGAARRGHWRSAGSSPSATAAA